jgi:hypothetical protein
MEHNNTKNEKIVFDLRRTYEVERTKFENELNREKERVGSALLDKEIASRIKLESLRKQRIKN